MKKLNLNELGWKLVEDNKSDYKFYYKKDDLTMSIRRFEGYSFIRIYKITENDIIDERFSGNVDEGNEELIIGNYIGSDGRCVSGKIHIDVNCKTIKEFNKIYKKRETSESFGINLHIKNKKLWFELLKIQKICFNKQMEQILGKQEPTYTIKSTSKTIEPLAISSFFNPYYGNIIRHFEMNRFEIFLYKLKNKFGKLKK